MKHSSYLMTTLSLVSMVTALSFSSPAFSQDNVSQEKLLERFEALEAEINLLRQQIAENKKLAAKTHEVAEDAANSVENVKALPEPVRANIWHVAGYADVGIEFDNGNINTSGKFNPSFHFQYKDLILFESELEIETSDSGETEFELEYSQLDFLLHDNAVLVAGKFLSPVGQFQERIHPSWINKLPNAPLGFGHGGVQPLSEVGLMLRGGVPVGDRTFSYSLAVGNGPRTGHDGVEAEGFGRDDNDNKAFSGRFGFLMFDNFELGASFLTSKISPEAEEAVPGDHGAEAEHDEELTLGKYELWGADFAYTKGNWDIRGEYLNAELSGMPEHDDPDVIADPTKWKTWYVQAAYRLSDISDSPIIRKLEPVIRYGQLKVEGDHELEEASEKRFNIGLNYWMSPSVVFKGAAEFRNFDSHHMANDKRLQFQLSYGF